LDLGKATDFTLGLSGTLHLSTPGGTATLYGYRGEQLCQTISVRDGEAFTLSDALGLTSVVVVPSAVSDVTLNDLSVIDRRDLLPQAGAEVSLATNAEVAIATAHPAACNDGTPWWWKNKVGSQNSGIN